MPIEALRDAELTRLGTQLLGDATLAVVVLLTATTLSIYKPWGRTAYGRAKQAAGQEVRLQAAFGPASPASDVGDATAYDRRRRVTITVAVIVAMVLAVVVWKHIASGGLERHGF